MEPAKLYKIIYFALIEPIYDPYELKISLRLTYWHGFDIISVLGNNLSFLKNIPATQDFGKNPGKQDVIELEGKIIESLPNANFRVQLESGQTILGYISGKLRMFHIRILPGDRVVLEVTPYDLTRGRITKRL